MGTRLAFLLFFSVGTYSAAAWGTKGRHLVVEIAHGLLEPQTIALVDHYLGTSAWTDAAGWLEASASPRAAESRKQWRRVLFVKNQAYVATRAPNLVNQIEYNLMVLEKRAIFSSAAVGEAIKTLFALVADAHQPLRCGYPADQGGALTKVSVAGETTTLLDLWDNRLLNLRPCDMWDCSKLIVALPGGEKSKMETALPLQWVTESRTLLNDVYALDKGVATEAYLDQSAAHAKQQLVKAGLRLAAILNKYFKG